MTYNAQQLAHIMKNDILCVDLNPDEFNVTWNDFVKVGELMINSGLSKEIDLEGVVSLASFHVAIDAKRATIQNPDFETYMTQLTKNTPKIDYDRLEKAVHEYLKIVQARS